MYGGQVRVPMVVRSMIGKSWGQGQHSQGLHALFMHIPGLKVVAPSNAHDAKGCMLQAIKDNNPVIFVEHRLLYSTEAFLPEEPFYVPFGKARRLTEGNDLTVVAISNMVQESLRAQELLSEIGVSVEVIDPSLWRRLIWRRSANRCARPAACGGRQCLDGLRGQRRNC